jgi:hypothetical protein
MRRNLLFEPATPLQDLDLVAVGILDEEEPGDANAIAVELDDLLRVEAERADAVMLAVEIGDRDGDVAVAVAKDVGLLPPLVDGQLDLESDSALLR